MTKNILDNLKCLENSTQYYLERFEHLSTSSVNMKCQVSTIIFELNYYDDKKKNIYQINQKSRNRDFLRLLRIPQRKSINERTPIHQQGP